MIYDHDLHIVGHDVLCEFIWVKISHVIETSTPVFGDGRISTHADLRPHATPYSMDGAPVA